MTQSFHTNPGPPHDDTERALCLANARLVLPDRVMLGQIHSRDGIITAISEGDTVPGDAVDCGGEFVMPGLVELHTDNLERHMEPRPGVDWPHLSALIAHDAELASTGITTVFDAMRVGSIHAPNSRYRAYARGLANELLAARDQGLFKISHFLHLRAEICSETLLQELAQFTPEDRVGLVSLMDHTPGQRQFRDLAKFKAYVSKKRGMDEAEFQDHLAKLYTLQDTYGAPHATGAVQEARRLGAVLASHDDTTRQHVATSHDNGVTLAEFPTTLEAARACRANGILVMMGAPNIIRGGSHSGNVSASDLAARDLLDIVSSDYIPAALLLSAFQLARGWGDLPRAIACVTATPARVAGLADRGALVAGLRADLVQVACPDGTPRVRAVWCRGTRVS